MKTDISGVSTCPPGEERWEWYEWRALPGRRVQYDWRAEDGKLFSCIARTLEEARARRDRWMEERRAGR